MDKSVASEPYILRGMSRLAYGLFRWSVVFGALASVGGCQPPTSFQGDPQFPGGPHGCFETCAKQNMQMASFVYVGEYSSACACKPLVKSSQPAADSTSSVSDEDQDQAAVVAAATGVELQRRRIEEEHRRHMQQQQLQSH